MFERYLTQEAARLSERFLDNARTLDEWNAKRPRLRQEFLAMVGLWPLPEKTPLHAAVTGTIEGGDFAVEKLHYQSRPGLYVTANLWRPREVKEKLPGVLLFVGHYNRGRNGHKTFMQDQGRWFARNGYVCLIMDTLARGELSGEHLGLYSQDRWWWIARGYTPAAVECWNAVRGIDYLVSRTEVDPNRIAATGLSGGGAVTFWISAVDDRVKVAAAHSGLTDWESIITSRILRLHCDCMIPYNTFGWELTTVGALIAPRPFLFVNCDDDLGFPMAGNRRIAERLRSIYRLHGREDAFQDYVTHGPLGAHSYTADSRATIFKWINHHLKGSDEPVKDVEEERFLEENLRTFPTDEDIPKGVLNHIIDQSFVPVAKVALPASGEFESWRAKLLRQLRESSFRTFPERIPPADKAPRPDEYRFVDWEREAGVQVWNTESGLLASTTLHGLKSNEPLRNRPVALVIINQGESLDELPEWAAAFIAKDEPYAILAPRGVGLGAWTREPAHYIERAHLCIGRTIDQGRVWDIAAVGRRLNGDGPIRVIGRGQAGVLGAYAALFEPAIQEVVAVDPPASHAAGPIFLNVLRVLDIPDALGMLAPRPLTLVNASNPVFQRTKEIYDRTGGRLLLASAPTSANLARALTLHASFDKGLEADYSRGDKNCYVAAGQELKPAATTEEVRLAPGAGRFGGALHFTKKNNFRPAYKDAGVLGYNDRNWNATVSVWLRLNPDQDLEPGYCDPVQIIGDDTKKGFIFLEWSKDETPRYFRYAIRPLFHIWNPDNVPWDQIPFEKRPMVQVARAPFSREAWTHAVFTLENLNERSKPRVGRLYLNGALQGTIENWDLSLGWDPSRVLLVLGAAYVGYMDDLAVFNRALTDAEIRHLHGLKGGIRELLPDTAPATKP